jgi:hypothetical protein
VQNANHREGKVSIRETVRRREVKRRNRVRAKRGVVVTHTNDELCCPSVLSTFLLWGTECGRSPELFCSKSKKHN